MCEHLKVVKAFYVRRIVVRFLVHDQILIDSFDLFHVHMTEISNENDWDDVIFSLDPPNVCPCMASV